MLVQADLEAGFRALGVQVGDTLLVHSSYRFRGLEGGPQAVIEALLAVLGPEGTLVMPTFNFAFCEGEPFDVRTTPSKMGVLTELVRQDPRSRRVFHPIYSFAIIGRHAAALGSLRYKSSFGQDSVFGQLRALDAKIMIIGLTYNNSMTFFHHIEEMEGVPYRYLKEFRGQVTDEQGQSYEDTFVMFVRDREHGVQTAVDPMGAVLEQRGVVTLGQVGGVAVKLMRAREVYRVTAEEMKREPGLLYTRTTPEAGAS